MVKKFLRRTWNRYSKLGKGRKKKQKWRNPTGRDNKMREMRRGYPAVISVGYKKDKNLRGLLDEKNPVIVNNIADLEKLEKNEIAIIGKVGNKKRLEILKIAKEKKIEIYNFNVEKFLKMNKKEKSEKKKEESNDKKETVKKSEKKTESKEKIKEKKQ